MQADLARAASMAGLLAAAAGWWGLDALLGQLAARAAAGTRPELHALMQARAPAGRPASQPAWLRRCTQSLLAAARASARGSASARVLTRAAPAQAALARRAGIRTHVARCMRRDPVA